MCAIHKPSEVAVEYDATTEMVGVNGQEARSFAGASLTLS
jgi:hypothetical protein